MWEEWDQRTFSWQEVIGIGRDFLNVFKEADGLFQS